MLPKVYPALTPYLSVPKAHSLAKLEWLKEPISAYFIKRKFLIGGPCRYISAPTDPAQIFRKTSLTVKQETIPVCYLL